MHDSSFSHFCPRQFPTLSLAILTSLGLLGNGSLQPAVKSGSPAVFSPATVLAQTPGAPTSVTSIQVSSYARSILEIEPIRRRYYQQARQILQREIPKNSCLGNNQANVPQGLEEICKSYLRESKAVIKRNELTLKEFNEITLRTRTDTTLSQRIQQELIRQQQKTAQDQR